MRGDARDERLKGDLAYADLVTSICDLGIIIE
jgi:hypothetical protein